MSVLQILNTVTGVVTSLLGLTPEIQAIAKLFKLDGSGNFQVTITTLEGDIMQTTGDIITDVDAWKAAHPGS